MKKLHDSGKSYRKIGQIFHISRQRVHQILTDYNSPHKDVEKWYDKYLHNNITLEGRDYIREIVRIRDNHTCRKCKKVWQKGQRRFDTHHLDEKFEGLNGGKGYYKIDKNLVDRMTTLCHKCHFSFSHIRRAARKARLRFLSTALSIDTTFNKE